MDLRLVERLDAEGQETTTLKHGVCGIDRGNQIRKEDEDITSLGGAKGLRPICVELKVMGLELKIQRSVFMVWCGLNSRIQHGLLCTL